MINPISGSPGKSTFEETWNCLKQAGNGVGGTQMCPFFGGKVVKREMGPKESVKMAAAGVVWQCHIEHR